MTNMNRILMTVLAAAALSVLPAGALPSTASAQEVQITGPLAGQPAVRHMRQYRVNRFFVTPSVGYTLQDEYARALFFGGSIGFSFLDWLGVSIWGAAAPLDIDTDLTTQVAHNGQVTDRNRLSLPSAAGFTNQVGRIRYGLSLQLLFVPLRGKLSLFQAAFVDTDLYILAGVAMFGLQERAPVALGNACETSLAGMSTPECVATQTGPNSRADRIAPAPMVGVGLTMMFNQFLGLQLEWRAFPFSWNPSGTDESGRDAEGQAGSGFPDGELDGDDSRMTFNHMFNIGLVIYLPTEVQVTE